MKGKLHNTKDGWVVKFEYIDDQYISEIKREIKRVSGGHYYGVRIFPNIFPVNLGFIETGTIQKFNSPSLDN